MPGWDETTNEWRFRIRDPKMFLPKSFRTKPVTDGIYVVIAKQTPNGSMMVQSIRFKKDKFTLSQAKKWFDKHPEFKASEFKAGEGEPILEGIQLKEKKKLSPSTKAKKKYEQNLSKLSKKKKRVGAGGRFQSLVDALKLKGVKDPEALAAWIGRKKYGSKAFQSFARRKKSKKFSEDTFRKYIDHYCLAMDEGYNESMAEDYINRVLEY